MICGNCHENHPLVEDVKACYAGMLILPSQARQALGKEPVDNVEIIIRPAHLKGTSLHEATEGHPEITEGMWKLGDRIIKIQRAVHGSGNLYGKELFVSKWPACKTCGCQKGEHGRMYGRPCMDCDCEAWVDGEAVVHNWQKIVGAVRVLREQGGRKMTLEEAEEFGALYGFCCVCGRTLTRESSIEAGIGPVCADKFSA